MVVLSVTRCSSPACGQPIFFRYTDAGKPMPLDATMLLAFEPGCYVLEGVRHCRPALPLLDTEGFYRPHWISCPDAGRFKR